MGIGRYFSFDSQIDRLPFVIGSILLLAMQQFMHGILMGDYWASPTQVLFPAFSPVRDNWQDLFVDTERLAGLAMAIPISIIVLGEWKLAALAFRRALTIGASPLVAVLAVVPFVQIAAVVFLALRNPRVGPEPIGTDEPRKSSWEAVVKGTLAGATVAVLSVIFFTLVLGIYGSSLFVGVPLFIGFCAGYIANRDEGSGISTYRIALGSLLLGALILGGFAIEGLVCILLIFPIAAILTFFGAVCGEAWAVHRKYRNSTLVCMALAPMLLGLEALSPPHDEFESNESIAIVATPMQVWDSVVHMGPIPARPAAPFGWGLAYPMRGTINGVGVGAVREGVFSTGVAYERVTAWEPGRKLEFVVLSDPPMMQELNPLGITKAPHTIGYFRTRDARFAITPMANGATRLTLSTRHELDIGPIAYFRPISDWAIRANKRRVLNHFRAQAEAAARAASPI